MTVRVSWVPRSSLQDEISLLVSLQCSSPNEMKMTVGAGPQMPSFSPSLQCPTEKSKLAAEGGGEDDGSYFWLITIRLPPPGHRSNRKDFPQYPSHIFPSPQQQLGKAKKMNSTEQGGEKELLPAVVGRNAAYKRNPPVARMKHNPFYLTHIPTLQQCWMH